MKKLVLSFLFVLFFLPLLLLGCAPGASDRRDQLVESLRQHAAATELASTMLPPELANRVHTASKDLEVLADYLEGNVDAKTACYSARRFSELLTEFKLENRLGPDIRWALGAALERCP